MPEQLHSTGRGGAGNIGEDTTQYVDGGITREGVLGESSRGEYSAGRGGAGNMIESPRTGTPVAHSQDVVTEPSMRTAEGHENFHTGRGGGGNVHKDKYGGHSHAQGGEQSNIVDKAKHALGMDKKKEHEHTTTTQ
ncbi:hypothetical protein LTR78_010300 [Recurvomyces mirabilis]|uniref:Uncharacterized protein n=1 Tax=Recurvomyces mirabilis TaxID=574656 RepID=A0AAE0TMQ0_9PEZI|nr:hypothetical protein LTR78_010300 [Recurvomyces mirabilis]KAK5149630.1 hypothetical protein LTS14_010761 [Recurvomyces mirabilis]